MLDKPSGREYTLGREEIKCKKHLPHPCETPLNIPPIFRLGDLSGHSLIPSWGGPRFNMNEKQQEEALDLIQTLFALWLNPCPPSEWAIAFIRVRIFLSELDGKP